MPHVATAPQAPTPCRPPPYLLKCTPHHPERMPGSSRRPCPRAQCSLLVAQVATVGAGGVVSLWDATGQWLNPAWPHAHTGTVWSVAFSPDGRYVSVRDMAAGRVGGA